MKIINTLLLWVALAIIAWGLTQGTHKATYVVVCLCFIAGTVYIQLKGSGTLLSPNQRE